MAEHAGFPVLDAQPPLTTRMALPAGAVDIRRNGIEFHSVTPIALWTEMTVGLEGPGAGRRVRCGGVVVSCKGNPQEGYRVSLLFTSLSPQSEAVLSSFNVQ